jgi:hypothetical protein
MSLMSYNEVRPWARAIRDRVVSREMPPWHADPAIGTFRNDRSLSQDEIDTIARWANAGAPQGHPADLPTLPAFADGWQIGRPERPKGEVFMGLVNNGIFEIPPGVPNALVESEGVFLEDVKIRSFRPHMHVRGRDMTYFTYTIDNRPPPTPTAQQ